MYQHVLTGAVLLICSIQDLRKHRISRAVLAGYLVLAVIGHMAGRTATAAELSVSLLPGALCLLLSWLSRQGLGYGDSVLAMACGVSVGLWPCVGILLTAFFLSGLWAVILLVFCRAERGREIPLVPFLFLGMLIQCAGGV